MEENIAIESESREKFEKTVKGIKKMLKSGTINPVETVEAIVEEAKTKQNKDKSDPIKKNRGVVYIGHIPHGFYEDQMKSFFTQFGKVTNVRVARSPKTGKSKGYGFVEFLNKEVAQIVAETMNNYLMDKRLLKAEYIPPEKQRAKAFSGKRWVPGKSCPGIFKRKKEIMKKNSHITTDQWLNEAKKRIKRLHKLKATLRAAGVDYDFFQPVDVPKELASYNPAQPNTNVNKKIIKGKQDDINKKESKGKQGHVNKKESKGKQGDIIKNVAQGKKSDVVKKDSKLKQISKEIKKKKSNKNKISK